MPVAKRFLFARFSSIFTVGFSLGPGVNLGSAEGLQPVGGACPCGNAFAKVNPRGRESQQVK